MERKFRWRKALSLLLAASMLAQNCAVISAAEIEAEIMIEQEGQESGKQSKAESSTHSTAPEISIEAVEPSAEPKLEDPVNAHEGREALYTVTFEPHSAERGVICVDGTDLTTETLSAYKKEVKAGGKYTFRVTASEDYAVDHVKTGNQDVAKTPDKTDEYEITVAKDTEIVITYKKLSEQAGDDTSTDGGEENGSAPEFQRAVLTVGQQSYIMGQEGTEHAWQILDESVVSIVSTDGAFAELKANAEGTVYIAHDYQVDGESDIKMETFEVTVTAGEMEAAAETEAAPETSAEDETESAAETEALTEIQTEAEALVETELETETETLVETETEVLVDETEVLAGVDVPKKVRNAAAMAAPMALDDGISLAAENEYTIGVGERLTLKGTSGSNHKWESSDSTIATVSEDDEKGTVKGVSEGTVIITHTWGSKKNKRVRPLL